MHVPFLRNVLVLRRSRSPSYQAPGLVISAVQPPNVPTSGGSVRAKPLGQRRNELYMYAFSSRTFFLRARSTTARTCGHEAARYFGDCASSERCIAHSGPTSVPSRPLRTCYETRLERPPRPPHRLRAPRLYRARRGGLAASAHTYAACICEADSTCVLIAGFLSLVSLADTGAISVDEGEGGCRTCVCWSCAGHLRQDT
ncbi:hypothetical protein C8Q80DRAFT_792054 [Daedaleopsis nitida]|nr:hypothetical protein C8Q80DRAFT_792054 [Daedaleopsis nitida]